MKAFLSVIFFLLAAALTRGQDEHFEFHSPFGSDGTNQPNLSPETRNALVFDHVWNAYASARQEILKPFPSPQGYSQAQTNLWMQELREGQLLETMAELRAFTSQNPGYAGKGQESELVLIDRALRSLGVHYTGRLGEQDMVDFCVATGVAHVSKKLAPLMYRIDGTPRPLPAYASRYGRVAKPT